MATFRALFTQISADPITGLPAPLLNGPDAEGTTPLTTGVGSGIVQSGGADWAAPKDGVVYMTCDGAVYVKIAAAPTAAAGDAWPIPANGEREVFIREGDKIAVIDA